MVKLTVSKISPDEKNMPQVKIYGLNLNIEKNRLSISRAIHEAMMSALNYPAEKKFHRFILLSKENFIYPDDRSEKYTIIEISMFEGRSVEVKKSLIRELYSNLETQCEISPQDIEITIFESPIHNWGIRGVPADELKLGYKIEV